MRSGILAGMLASVLVIGNLPAQAARAGSAFIRVDLVGYPMDTPIRAYDIARPVMALMGHDTCYSSSALDVDPRQRRLIPTSVLRYTCSVAG